MSWISIYILKDNDKISKGVAFKLLPTPEGTIAHNYIPEEGLYYILVDLPGDHMCLSCISDGEQGNTMSYLKKDSDCYITGKEIKRILLDKTQLVLINMTPKYSVR